MRPVYLLSDPEAARRGKVWPSRLFHWLDRWAAWILPAPAVVVILLLTAFPAVYTLYMSTHDWFASSLTPPRFSGEGSCVRMLAAAERLRSAVWRALPFSGLAGGLEMILGVAIAVVFNRDFLGRGLVRTLLLLPMVATPAAIALVWAMMYHPTLGVINYLVQLLGFPPLEWIANPRTVIPALVIVDAWEWTPLITLMALAWLAALPAEPYASARVAGASGWQIFWFITLPLLRPTLMVAALFRTIDALKTFDIIYIMTQGGPGFASETLNVYIFQTAFLYFHMGYASALLVALFALVLSVSFIVIRLRRAA